MNGWTAATPLDFNAASRAACVMIAARRSVAGINSVDQPGDCANPIPTNSANGAMNAALRSF